MTRTITRMFDSYDDAKAAASGLERAGVSHHDISVVANNGDAAHDPTKAAEDAGVGAGIGATIGGVGGLLAGLGMLAIPGVGPVVAAGWLAATAAGVGAGAIVGGAAGGIVGALQKEGVSEREAHVYAEGVRRGGTVVSAKVGDDDVAAAEAVLDRYQPVNLKARDADYRERGWTAFDEHAPAFSAADIAQERARHRLGEPVGEAPQFVPPKATHAGGGKLSDEAIESEMEMDATAEDRQLGGRFADDFDASHQGGSGAQGGQTDFGRPDKFAGPGT